MLTISRSRWAQSRWPLRLTTFAVWALAAASVLFWGLRLGAAPLAPPAAVVAPPAPVQADPVRVARLLGAVDAAAGPAQAAPLASSRFALVGVVADRARTGAALIAVDGKPARPYRVGAQVEPGLLLQSVGPRTASLGAAMDGPASFSLEVPLRPAAAGVGSTARPMPAPPPAVPAQVPQAAPAVSTPAVSPPAAAAPGVAPGMTPPDSPGRPHSVCGRPQGGPGAAPS